MAGIKCPKNGHACINLACQNGSAINCQWQQVATSYKTDMLNDGIKKNDMNDMKETLEAEKARLIEKIKQYDEQHKEAAKLANVFRKQLTQINRSIAVYDVPAATPTDAEAVQEISNGLEKE